LEAGLIDIALASWLALNNPQVEPETFPLGVAFSQNSLEMEKGLENSIYLFLDLTQFVVYLQMMAGGCFMI